MAVLIDPAGGVVDRVGSAGDYEEPSAKVGHQITLSFSIELQPLQDQLRRGRETRAEQRVGIRPVLPYVNCRPVQSSNCK